MPDVGPVSQHLEAELRETARQHGIVVWLDKESQYTTFAEGLAARAEAGAFPFPVRAFRGSFLELMLQLDGLEDGIGQQPLVVHVPGYTEDEIARTPLFELYRAGRRHRRALPTLVKEAAHGRATPTQIDGFLQGEGLSLEGADAWLSQVGAGGASDGPDLSALSASALVEALFDGGTLVDKVQLPEVQRAVWRRAEVVLGLSSEARQRFYDSRLSAVPGQARGELAAASPADVLLELVGWTLAVEFVWDLRRPPREAWLQPLKQLPKPMVEACRTLARHLRERHPERYIRWASEVEDRLREELDAASAEDLGQVDTFRLEDHKVFLAALDALRRADYVAAHAWSVARRGGRSFWSQQDRQRARGWQLLEQAAQLGSLVHEQEKLLQGVRSHAEAVERYAKRGYVVDTAHRRLEQLREQAAVLEMDEYPELRRCLDEVRRVYRGWADLQAERFNELCSEHGFLPSTSLQQRTLFDDVVRPWSQEEGTTAYFMVDALRYELAEQLASTLRSEASTTLGLKARLAELPTVTEVGMNVLAPLAKDGKLWPEINAKGEIVGFRGGQSRVGTPDARQKAIHERVGGKACPKLSVEEVLQRDVTSLRKAIAEARVVVVHGEGIDKAGEKGVGLVVFEQELRKLRSAWRQLREAGVRRFVFTADHGFLLHDAVTRDPLPHGKKTFPKRRHLVSFDHVQPTGVVSVSAADIGYAMDREAWFLMPCSAAPFDIGEKAKDFVHGGNSLQERVIPVLTLEHRHAAGATTVRYELEARAKSAVARMQRLELTVRTQGQGGLAFGGPKELEVVLESADDPKVQVQLLDAADARISGNGLFARIDHKCEVFFRLTGPRESRVRVRVRDAAGGAMDPATTSARFTVERLGGVETDAEEDRSRKVTQTAVEMDAWLLELPEGGVRDVFRHLSVHRSVNEAEATKMLGGARQFRRFSLKFEEYSRLAPFSVRIENASGSKCYVKGEG